MTQAKAHTHEPSIRTYLLVFAALMILLIATVWAAKLTHGHGAIGVVIAMLIATAKAVLVVLFFMHVKGSTMVTKVFVVVGLLWLAILVGLTLNDYMTREWLPPSRGWHQVNSQMPQAPEPHH